MYNSNLSRDHKGVNGLTPSITAAFLAMLLIGAADAINKRARQQAVPIGSYLIIQSLFYTLIVLVLALLSGGIKWQRADLVFSLLAAIFGFAGFTLMLHSLTHGHASVNYAIFRSSFIFSTAAAVLLLNERLYVSKIVGIALACLAIFLFFYEPKRQTLMHKSLFIAMVAMFVAAGFQLIVKLSTQVFSSPLSFILLTNIFFGIFVLVYNIIFGSFKFPGATFVFAPINGILMALATFFYVTALQKGELSTAIPIIQLSFIITAISSALFLKEGIGMLKVFGIICAAIAIMVLGIF
jgi:drug/metabolite transporter (DMT)-like permease